MRSIRVGHSTVTVGKGPDIVDAILSMSLQSSGSVVVTPNIHHIASLERDAKFRKAYDAACCWPADGWPVALLASFLSRERVPRVSGSDLIDLLCAKAAEKKISVAVLGGSSEEAADLAKENLEALFPGLDVVFCDPVPDLASDDSELATALSQNLCASGASIVFLGVGAPKQEIFAALELAPQLRRGVVVCIGAGIDFSAGVQRRANVWMRKLGMEWAYRLWREPRRLSSRYLLSGIVFARIALIEIIRGTRWR